MSPRRTSSGCARAALASGLALALLAITPTLHAANYNFAYRSSGDAHMQPVQVFDDGQHTYFQWRRGQADPAIFLDTGASLQLQVSRRQGDYLSVPMLGARFVLRFGQLEARVVALTTGTGSGVPASAPAPHTSTPVWLDGQQHKTYSPPPTVHGAASPLYGDGKAAPFTERELGLPFAKGKTTLSPEASAQLSSLLSALREALHIQITGREDGPEGQGLAHARALAVQDWLLAAGVPLERLVLKEKPGRDADATSSVSDLLLLQRGRPVTEAKRPPPAQPATPWQLSTADATLDHLLARWGRSAGWRVHWKASAQVPVTGDAVLERSGFLEAADAVVEQARALGHRIKATAYSNQVLVISEE